MHNKSYFNLFALCESYFPFLYTKHIPQYIVFVRSWKIYIFVVRVINKTMYVTLLIDQDIWYVSSVHVEFFNFIKGWKYNLVLKTWMEIKRNLRICLPYHLRNKYKYLIFLLSCMYHNNTISCAFVNTWLWTIIFRFLLLIKKKKQ